MRTGPRKSGGEIPPAQPLRDMNQALALLSALHNFTIKKTMSGYEVTIRQAGRRVNATGGNLMATIQNALRKLRGEGKEKRTSAKSAPSLRLVGGAA